MRRALLATLLALAACEPTNRPTMNPGQDCMTCHVEGGQANRLRWTAAGTVFRTPDSGVDDGVEGAHVLILDHENKLVSLRTNSAGNFYTDEPLDADAGLQVLVEYQGHCRPMHATPKPSYSYENTDKSLPNGPVYSVGCNHCHTDPAPYFGLPVVNPDWHYAPGRLTIPQYFEPLTPPGDVFDGDANGNDAHAVLRGTLDCIFYYADGGALIPADAGVFDD